jgi:putative PIN family toxin of toxin-antitoxin system
VFESARQGRFRLVASPFIINETGKVLRRLGKVDGQAITRQLKDIAHIAEIVQPTTSIQVVRDPKDDPIVECAVDGKADMIVSLDKDLLTLKAYNNIPILHVVDLLRILGV